MGKLIDIHNLNHIKNLDAQDLLILQAVLNSTKIIGFRNVVNSFVTTFGISILLLILISKITKVELYINDRKIV
jgi:hypothetical protein